MFGFRFRNRSTPEENCLPTIGRSFENGYVRTERRQKSRKRKSARGRRTESWGRFCRSAVGVSSVGARAGLTVRRRSRRRGRRFAAARGARPRRLRPVDRSPHGSRQRVVMAAGGPRRCTERPWDHWVAALGRDRPRQDEPPAEEPPPPPRLRRAHMPLHGQLPAAPPLLALCALCGAAIALCAARAHLVERHAAPPLPPPPSTPPRHKRRTRPHPPSEHPHTHQHQHQAALADPAAASSPAGASESSPLERLPSTATPPPPALVGWPAPQPAQSGQSAQSAERSESFDVEPKQEAFSEESSSQPALSRSVSPAIVAVSSAPRPPVAPVEPEVTSKSKLKSSKSSSNKPKYAVREFDPNKHCGVVTGDPSKPCTRSLTCKSHALSLRRLVGGRIKPFDALLKEHRAAKQGAPVPSAPSTPSACVVSVSVSTPQETQITVAVPELSSPVLVSTPVEVSIPPFVAPSPDREQPASFYPTLPVVGEPAPVVVPEEADLVPLLHRDVVECLGGQISISEPPPPPPEKPRLPEYRPSDVHWYVNSPRPLATCTFSACQMGSALFLNRRLATVRSNFKSTVARSDRKTASNSYYNFSQNSLPSMSKTTQSNNAGKFSMPKVRKLIVAYPSFAGTNVKTDQSVYYNTNRQNGHSFANKRPLLSDFEDETKFMRTSGPSVDSVRSDLKVTKRANPSDMLELSFMYDHMMADEKC